MTSRRSKVAIDSPKPRRRPYYVDRLPRHPGWRSAHVRFALANAVSLPLPKFTGSRAVRGRLFRWAGFRITDGRAIGDAKPGPPEQTPPDRTTTSELWQWQADGVGQCEPNMGTAPTRVPRQPVDVVWPASGFR